VAQAPDSKTKLPRPFGAYHLLRRLAAGGMAEVFVAKARGLGGFEKLVALKVIHPRLSVDDQFVTMLVDEAKLSVLLNHANIAQTFDLGCNEGRYFIVMEYVEGADASRLLRKANEVGQWLPIEACLFVMSEVLAGLEYAHKKADPFGKPLSIVHRDVSPQNVLLSMSGEVKLADFGIAKAALRTSETEVGVIKGKYYYMSPEQAWADPMDHRSDVFSAGVVLYELLTGRMLYQEESVPALLEKVRRARVPPPSRLRPEISPELDALCLRALARRPEERFASAADFGEALARLLYGVDPAYGGSRLAKLMNDYLGGDTVRLSAPLLDVARLDAETAVAGGLPVMRSQEFVPEPQSVIFEVAPSTQPPPRRPGVDSDGDETVVLDSSALLSSERPTPRPPRPSRHIVEAISGEAVERDRRARDEPAPEEDDDAATSVYERSAELRSALAAEPIDVRDLPTPPRGIRRPRALDDAATRRAAGPSSVELDPGFAQEAEELGRRGRGERLSDDSTVVDPSGETTRRVEEMLAMASPSRLSDEPGRRSSLPPSSAALAATWEPPRPTWEPLPFIGPPLPAGGLAMLPLQSSPGSPRATTPRWIWAAVALGIAGAGSAIAALLAG
jgi:hypothetical protein